MTAPILKPLDPKLVPDPGGGLSGAVGSAVCGSSVMGGTDSESPGSGYQEQIYRVLMGMLPPGAFLDRDDEPHAAMLYGWAKGLGSALEFVYQLADEVFPQSATGCLEDWEELYHTAVPAGASLDDRRAALLALSRGGKSCSVPSLTEQLEPVLGADCFTLYENFAQYVTPQPEQIFFAFVWRDPAQPGTYNIEAAQRLADRTKEAHVLLLVGESNSFLSNDTYSRTNRDILGA